MQVLFVIMALAALIVMGQFASGDETPFRVQASTEIDESTYQLEQFARAAWHVARTGVSGPINRSAMILPTGYNDDPARPFMAQVEGDYLYVWETTGTAAIRRPEAIFPEADTSVDVGVSNASAIVFRDGTSAARPAWLPFPNLIVRLRV